MSMLMASQSNQYEIMAATVAAAQSRDQRVRKFAEAMINDHAHSRDSLGKAVIASNKSLPAPGMSSDQALLLGTLQSLRGSDFDRAYVKQQVLAHIQAIAVEESFANAGADKNLKAVVKSDLPMIREHLKMARNLQAELEG